MLPQVPKNPAKPQAKGNLWAAGRREPGPWLRTAAAEHGPVLVLAGQGREGSLRQGPGPLRAARLAPLAAHCPAAAQGGPQPKVSARGP